jgi:SAM-dependent methyltransferase
MNSNFIKRNELIPVMNLGNHSFADTFIPSDKQHISEPVFPLEVGFEPETGLFKNIYITEAQTRYNFLNYSYTSANSPTSRQHWQELAKIVKSYFAESKPKILEIGSNDGYLLQCCAPFASLLLGVDASAEMSKISSKNKINTITGIFGEDEDTLSLIESVSRKWDLIIANNVLNHSNNPIQFLSLVHKLLSPNGLAIMEVPYWPALVQDNRFDQIYHEHVNYFTAKSILNIAIQNKLSILKVEFINYHGGSLRIYFTNSQISNGAINNLISQEIKLNIYELKTYSNFMNKIKGIKDRTLDMLLSARSSYDLLVGVGAAAKSNTFLTFCNINNSILDAVTDSSKYKIGKFTPVTRIPILSDDIIKDSTSPLALILAWNLSDSIESRIKKLNSSVRIERWS